jgi:hypothetical protein
MMWLGFAFLGVLENGQFSVFEAKIAIALNYIELNQSLTEMHPRNREGTLVCTCGALLITEIIDLIKAYYDQSLVGGSWEGFEAAKLFCAAWLVHLPNIVIRAQLGTGGNSFNTIFMLYSIIAYANWWWVKGIPFLRFCCSNDDEEASKKEKHMARTKEVLGALHTDSWAAYKKYHLLVLDLPYSTHNNRDIAGELFEAIDTDGSNRIDVEEFKQFTHMLRCKYSGSIEQEGGAKSGEGGEATTGRTSSADNDEAVEKLFETIKSASRAKDSISKDELTNFLKRVLDST